MSIGITHALSIFFGILNSFWNNIHPSQAFDFLSKGKTNGSNTTIGINQMVILIYV